MNVQTKGAAKRLILSLLMASGLGGCAVYPPYAYDSYPYGDGYGVGPSAYPAYPAYSPYPAYSAYSAYPAYPAYPAYSAYPTYVGPPISFDLGFGFFDHGGGHFRGHHGHHGHGGFHGGRGGWRR